jgi:SRSO17 transposase
MFCQEDSSMTRDEVRAVGRRLAGLHSRFSPCFGRSETQHHSLVYLKGLLLGEGRKNVERIALRWAETKDGSSPTQNEVVALQEFLTISSWKAHDVMQEIRKVFAEEFVPSTSQWSIGTVGVIDESGFPKSGPESCGVKRQYCGRLGQTANCQVGVFLIGVTPAGTALLDHQLYLPKEWVADGARRKKTRVPDDVRFRTKPQIALDQVKRVLDEGHVRFDWIVADALYGHDGPFLDALQQLQQRYVVQVAADTRVWPKEYLAQIPPWLGRRRPGAKKTRQFARTVATLGAELPASAWQVICLREGAKGPMAFEFARIRAWSIRNAKPGPPVWLVIRRSLETNPEYKYYLSNADESTSLETLALVGSTRFRVEEFFEETKGELGLGHYEARAWSSWHHHMSLVALAHLFVVQTRRELKIDTPQLTLPMALELLKSAFKRPSLTEDDAIHLTEYHLHRNEVARKSHRKSWLQKHQAKIPKGLL